jgi:hypothetical protein
MQRLNSPPPCAPSRRVPTWADIVRGKPCTQREAPAVSPAEIIAIYQCCAAAGVQAHFSVKNLAGFQEGCLICRFTDTAAPRPPPARRPQRLWRRNRGKPASSSITIQIEPVIATLTSRPHHPASPLSLARTPSPTAPPPAKNTRKPSLRA